MNFVIEFKNYLQLELADYDSGPQMTRTQSHYYTIQHGVKLVTLNEFGISNAE